MVKVRTLRLVEGDIITISDFDPRTDSIDEVKVVEDHNAIMVIIFKKR